MNKQKIQKEIGARIKQSRLDNGFTQHELSMKTGIEVTNISRLERGISQTIGFDALNNLCNVLKVNPKIFMVKKKLAFQ